MSPMLIGITAVILVVVLAGLLLLKRKNSNDAPRPSANRPKTLAEQQQELEQQRQAKAQIQPDHIQPVISNHLDSGKYASDTEVTNQSSKPILDPVPTPIDTTHSDAGLDFLAPAAPKSETPDTLATLATLATTNLDSNPTHKSNSDLNSDLGNKLDDDLDLDLDLDFDFDLPQPAVSTTVYKPTSASKLGSTPNSLPGGTTNQTIAETADQIDVLHFDLNRDRPTTDKPATPSTPVTEPVKVIQSVSNTEQTASTDDIFDFDFDQPVLSTPTNATPTAAASPTLLVPAPAKPVEETPSTVVTSATDITRLMDDLTFDLSTPNTDQAAGTVTTPVLPVMPSITTPTEPPMALSDDLDMDFAASETPKPTTLANTVTAHSASAPAVEASQPSNDFILDDGFELDFATPSTTENKLEVSPLTAPTFTHDNTVDQFDALATDSLTLGSFDTEGLRSDSPASANPVETVASLATPPAANAPVSSDSITPPSTEAQPTTDAPADFDSMLEVLQGLDPMAINVELAEQYIALGETDSAKRLLAEIANTDRADIASKVQALLDKID